jgi:hypothetical protein
MNMVQYTPLAYNCQHEKCTTKRIDFRNQLAEISPRLTLGDTSVIFVCHSHARHRYPIEEPVSEENSQRVQRALNEAKKSELAERYGAHFSESSPELPPDIESRWLENIEEFERQFENVQRCSVRELLGFPEFKPLDQIPVEQLEHELDKARDLLSRHRLVIDCLAVVSPGDLYRFITTELLDQEVDNVRIEGWDTCFIYEDFHPNDEYDAKSMAEHFLWDLFERNEEEVLNDFSQVELRGPTGRPIGYDAMRDIIRSFYATYAVFTAHEFQCDRYKLEGQYFTVTAHVCWAGLRGPSMEAASYEGRGTFKMRKSPDGGFDIVQAMIPGFDQGVEGSPIP